MKWTIRLYSKYTGDLVACLGEKFDSYEAAMNYTDKEVCSRCHRISIIPIPDNAIWKSRLEGFTLD